VAAPSREPPGNFSRAALLFDLLVGVVQRYEPLVAAVLREEKKRIRNSTKRKSRKKEIKRKEHKRPNKFYGTNLSIL